MANSKDGWDWPYIVYVGRVWLRYSTEELWKLTPRQFKSQLDVHATLKNAQSGGDAGQAADVGYIDQIPGW